MAFWIIAVLVLIAIVVIFAALAEDFGFFGTLLMGALSSILVVIVGFFVLGGVCLIAPSYEQKVETSQYKLRALDTGSGIEGRGYFLGGGYIDSERVLKYIVKHENGSNEIGDVDADEALVWEDTPENPYMVKTKTHKGNPWVAPFPYTSEVKYDFHIPEGSILESTQIDNK